VRVKHDLALLNLTVLSEETHNVVLSETRVDSSDEKVGSGVGGTITISVTTAVTTTLGRVRHVIRRTTVIRALSRSSTARWVSLMFVMITEDNIPVKTSGGGRAVTLSARRVASTGGHRAIISLVLVTRLSV
jgi:phage tail sheath gpL-like